MAELTGPGLIRHMWFSLCTSQRYYPRSIVIRIYWDGASSPAVEAPLGDLFAVGHGLRRDLNSALVSISAEGRAYNAYWPMPFRRSAKITVTNESDQRVVGWFWQIDWGRYEHPLPADVCYFHAQYRQEWPALPGNDYLILDTTGSGYYVGTVLNMHQRDGAGWFGEGDDRFYIDGEAEPSLRGTGTEDAFGDCWAFHEFQHPYRGVTLWEGSEPGDRLSAYRWYWMDPIPFRSSLRVTIEHKGSSDRARPAGWDAGFGERADDFSSVAFWYQNGQAKRFATLPPAPERMALYQILEAEILLRDEHGALPDGVARLDSLESSGDAMVTFLSKTGGALEVPFDIAKAGLYDLRAFVATAANHGIYDVFVDQALVARDTDLWSRWLAVVELPLLKHRMEAGRHTMRFVYKGMNPHSRGQGLGVDCLALFPLGE